jgi:sphingomyelin phosphodiesterase
MVWHYIGGQLKWLDSTLRSSQSRGERCYIIGHIPFGSAIFPWYSDALHRITDPYSSLVVAQLFGHTHMDAIQLARDVATDREARRISYIAPSLTPQTNINPSFRMYSYNQTSGDIIDYSQYSTNLEVANANRQLIFTRRYTARHAYNLTSLTPSSWLQFVKNLSNDSHMFTRYLEHHVTGRPTSCATDPVCIKGVICDAASATPSLYQRCMGPTSSIWKQFKRESDAPDHTSSSSSLSTKWQRAPKPFPDLC